MTAGISFSKNSAAASLPEPRRWAFVAFAVRHQVAPTPALSATVVNQKAAATAASKPRSSGCRSRAISFPTATGSISLYHASPALALFQQQLAPSRCAVPGSHPRHVTVGPQTGRGGWYILRPAYVRQTAKPVSAYPPLRHLLRTRRESRCLAKHFLRSTHWRKSGAVRSRACCATVMT